MKKIKHLNKALLSIITTLGLGGAITGSAILAGTTTNVDKLELLTRAVQDNTVEQLQSKRGDIVIELGYWHSAAIINGALFTWGDNWNGQLGLGDRTNRTIPTRVTQLPSGPITQIALGDWHSAAIINGGLYTWGNNDYGQLGQGNTANIYHTPTQVTQLPGGSITQIALGAYHSAAIIDGALYTWGGNDVGQLGIGPLPQQNRPKQVTTTANGVTIAPRSVTKIALGYGHSAAVINGALYTWGWNDFGQLGLGDETRRTIPTQVIRTSNGVITPGTVDQIALGKYHSAAVINGTLYTWGNNNSGQLGLGDRNNRNIPTLVTRLPSGSITQIALGNWYSAAIINGALYTWGDNDYGQLGLGDYATATQRNTTPTQVIKTSVGTITPGTVDQIALGSWHSAAIIDGELYTWGGNNAGQLGLGDTTNRNMPTLLTQIETTKKNVITLDSINDKTNIRDKIVYNITIDDIKTLLNQEPSIIPGLVPPFSITNMTFKSKVGASFIDSNNVGQLIVTYTANSKKYETTFNGFRPVNQTQNITIAQKSLPVNETSFANDEINQLVADANADTAGRTNKLSKWIINNSSLIIGNTANEYTSDFPRNAHITKISDVKVVNGSTGTLSFKIDVDKYYKPSTPTTNLIESTSTDTNITLTKPITLTGFKTTTKSNPSVINNSNRNLNATELLALFGNTNNPIIETGLTNLKNYIDLSSFPTSATFKIINHSLNGTSLSFQIEATGYYDDNGIVRTESKLFDSLTIDRLVDGTSNLIQADTYDKLTPNDILKHIGYDSNNPTKPLITTNLLDYVTIEKAFPENVQFTLAQAPNISANNTQLTLSIKANTWTNVDGSTNSNPKAFGPFTYNGLSSILNTNITLKEKHNTDLLAGDLIRNFGWDNATGSFDPNAVSKYIDFSSGVKKAKYTMKNLVDTNGKVSFSIVADRIYIDGIDTQIETTYDFEITGLKTIVDSASRIFLRENIVGNDNLNGHAISNQIIDHFSIGKEIGHYDELWNNLFDVSIYPQNTTFTINDISVEGVISKTFNIKFTASNYYQDNTTMNVPAPIRTVIVNNLKFTPTSATIKDQLPNIDPYQFFKYISYNDATKSFDQIALQEFLNLEGFDLNNPGIATKLIDPKIEDNQVKFNLEVQNYVDQDGLLVNETKIFKIAIDANRLLSIALTDNQEQSSVDAIIGATIGGVIGFSLLVILTGLLIRRNKNKAISPTK